MKFISFIIYVLLEIFHSVEKREILSHWKKISSNHLFSNFYSKTNAFTKFLQKKCEREFLQFPHCVFRSRDYSTAHSLEITEIYSRTFVTKKFRENNVFTREVTKGMISRNIFWLRVNFSFLHTVLLITSATFKASSTLMPFLSIE